MASDGKSTATPRLRFPEFQDDGGWSEIQFDQVLKFQAGFPFPSTSFNSEGVGLRLVRNRDLRSDDKPVHYSDSYSSEFLVADGDILIGMDGDFTPCVWTKGKALLNQRVGRVLPKNGSDQRFLLYLLTAHLKEIEETTARTTVKHLSHSDVEKISGPIPEKLEQQKIADCLTSLDDVIAAQGRKVEALETHRQGLMQHLFPRKGETLPRLRFPEFRDGPEWAEQKAGSLFANRGDKGEAGFPIYSVTIHDGLVKRSSLDRNFGDIEDPAGNRKAKKNDIAYNMMRMWQGALGVAVEDCMVSPAYIVLAPEKGVVSQFFVYLLKLPASLHLLTAHSRGLTKDRLRLYYDDFARITFRCPTQPEQQRISDCISSLDAQIAAESKKLDELKAHRSGLMQQLFPSPVGA